MQQLLKALKDLCLDSLDDDWVASIYNSEFLEIAEFPTEYESALESVNINKVFRNILTAINNWNGTNEEKSWAALAPLVKHQRLLTVLAFHIDNGTKNVHTKEYRNNALSAARVYYKLLSIPGFTAYHIYHAQLFTHSLACLSFPKDMCDKDENYFNTKELSREVNSVIQELFPYVLDLKSVVEKLQLKPVDMNFEDILSNLVDITGGAIVNKLNIDKIELANITKVIYTMIGTLLQNQNGEPNAVAINLLFKCLLPKLVTASADCRNTNNLVRASYVTYSGLLLSRYGKSAVPSFTVLIEHLCYTLDGLERAEVRNGRVSLVVGLMSLLPRRSYRNIVRWLLKLTTTAKIGHRQIALEILSKLLCNDPEEAVEQITSQNENQSLEQKKKTNTDESEKQEEAASGSQNTDDTSDQNKDLNQSENAISNEDESSQEQSLSKEMCEDIEPTEEEMAGLLIARPPTIPHLEVLRAIMKRAADVSGTLRTRALAILADCINTNRAPIKKALEELNSGSEVARLVALAARCASDERATVRRAAVGLMQKLMTSDEANLTAANLGVLVSLCRDASILVRSAAIAAISELVIQRANATVMDAFLSGPLHQLSDPESKVQEQVVTLVHHILIERLQKFSPDDNADPLPWIFLASVIKHNMRRHLQKACNLLTKSSKCISHRLVDILSSHLGALGDERDLQTLVLLTSVARHVDYTEVAFLLDYYYKLADDLESRDCRLLPLTVEALEAWVPWICSDARVSLHAHLVRLLPNANNNRTVCAALAAHLDPENLQWATKLMQIYERRALSGGGVADWVCAADMSLVAPRPPSPALLKLFLKALETAPDCDESSRGALVAGLGRLCLRCREAAAAAAPSLARALFSAAEPISARVNALRALTDICARYTCIVEPLLETVCGCLSLESPAPLRRAATAAITRLLLAGFLRLRTPLYYRYCALLADEDHDVREPAEYYVTSCLGADVIYHHFVECVLYYNKEDSASISFDARQLIYDVMLQRMSLVQRLNVQCRLAREVLGHAADMCDESDELEPALNAALLDTITLLCGPRMKLPRKPQNSGEPADIDDLQERITTNIVSHKMKRTVAEVLVPAVLRLYAHMRTRGGQLAAYLVRIATDLLHDYRQEIEELIENDEELVERVRQFQETIGMSPSFGNSRNLVTSSTAVEPDTPRTRRRPAPRTRTPRTPAKRALVTT